MKNIFKYIIPAALALVAAAACEDHRSDNMEEFQTMVYFRNGGEQDLTLFRTGEDGLYQIPVCKSGRNLSGTASAVVIPFDDAQMAMYNITNETGYTLIPASCYQFVDDSRKPLADQEKVQISFDSTDPYQVVSLNVNTVAISELQEVNPDAEYVMAFQLFSPGNVSDNINCIILKPAVEIPMLSLLSPGVEEHHYTGASAKEETYRNTVSLNMEKNEWDFNVNLEVMDQSWLTSYNNINGTSYELLPEGLYNLPVTEISFTEGVTEVPFDVKVSREGMAMLTEYALPIKLTSSTKEEFELDENASLYLLVLRLDPDQITLTEDMITVSANQSNDGGGAPALVDGDISTYWHTPWSSVVKNPDSVYGVYIDIELKTALRSILFNYCTRTQNSNGVPTHIVIGVSNDGATWTQIGDYATDEMANAGVGKWISLPVATNSESFTHIRFGIAESVAGDLRSSYSDNQPWTSLAELELYGTDM